jgi:hypothetical protein
MSSIKKREYYEISQPEESLKHSIVQTDKVSLQDKENQNSMNTSTQSLKRKPTNKRNLQSSSVVSTRSKVSQISTVVLKKLENKKKAIQLAVSRAPLLLMSSNLSTRSDQKEVIRKGKPYFSLMDLKITQMRQELILEMLNDSPFPKKDKKSERTL